MRLPASVTVVEVGPRDGLQEMRAFVPTEGKLRWIRLLLEAGLGRVEATAFVSPRWIPALADAEDVARGLSAAAAGRVLALVPNRRGVERAAAAGVRRVTLVVSASEGHSRANLNRSVREALEGAAEAARAAQAAGLAWRAGISCAFGCPFDGEVPVRQVAAVAGSLAALGPDEIALADTIGVAHPVQVAEVFGRTREAVPGVPLSAHFHDRRGFGLANALAALQSGVTVFDTALGGLGGCPYAPGAPGNLATERFVDFCEAMGISTGVDRDRLAEARRFLEQIAGPLATGG
jgi:hydroxymethylglutaryl-CoA lyase